VNHNGSRQYAPFWIYLEDRHQRRHQLLVGGDKLAASQLVRSAEGRTYRINKLIKRTWGGPPRNLRSITGFLAAARVGLR